MVETTQMQDSARTSLCFLLSVAIHAIIIVVLFVRCSDIGFKKGTSLDQMMKVAGFQILGGGDSISHQDMPDTAMPSLANPTPKSRNQIYTPQNNTKTQETPQSARQSLDLSSLSLYQGTTQNKNTAKPKSKIKALAKFPGIDNITLRDVEELYGEEFGDYGLAEQEFLINNLRDIGRITSRYLKYPPSAIRLGQQGVSAVEFYLHPNGDISGLKIIVSSEFMLLDRNSERTIEIAYKDYPRPVSKTKIRIFVTYGIHYYGY